MALGFLSGCSTADQEVSLQYKARYAQKDIALNGAGVRFYVEDIRSTPPSQISAMINRYGVETATVKNDRPIEAFVQSALESEVVSRGFSLRDDGAKVHVMVQNFYAAFQAGMGEGAALAQVAFRVNVLDSDDETVYSEYVSATTKRPTMLVKPDTARTALEIAFLLATKDLLRDPSFLSAIVDVGTPATAAP